MISDKGENLVFLLSLPRSGSTILSLLLGNHSQVYCPPEPWLLLRLAALTERGSINHLYDDEVARTAVRDFLQSDLSYEATRAFATTAYNHYLKLHDKTIFVDKTPRYYHILPFIDKLFPKARKIWLKRNPLDVALSYKNTWSVTTDKIIGQEITPYSFDFAVGLFNLATYFEARDSNQLEIQYEDLACSPTETLQQICDFIEIPFEAHMFEYAQNKTFIAQHQSSYMGDVKALATTSVHDQSVGKWAQNLSNLEIQQLIDLLGFDIFFRMGYEGTINTLQQMGLTTPSESAAAEARNQITQSNFDKLIEMKKKLMQIEKKWQASEIDRAARLRVIQQQENKLAKLETERKQLNQILRVVVGTRTYKILRRLGRWDWFEQAFTRLVSPPPSPNSNSDFYQVLREPKHQGGIAYSPQIIRNIIAGLNSFGYEVQDYHIDVADYRAYFEQAAYKKKYPTYYDFNLPEKSLEHYIAAKLLQLSPKDVYIDIASEGSPVPEIYQRLYGCTTYRQDLSYPPGLNNRMIGGNAADMPVPDGFASKMALHCSFEHFEGDSDINFITEAGRVLKPGGAVCIVPFYLHDKYAILTDPNVAVPQKVQFEEDAILYCDPNWKNRHGRFYDPAHLYERIHKQLNGMKMTIYKIMNAREVDSSCYVEFAGLINKP